MKLNSLHRDLISVTHLNADIPLAQLTKSIGKPEHVVRHNLRRLLEEGVLSFHPFIDLGRLGFSQYTLFFSLSHERNGDRDRLLRYLINCEETTWVGRMAGEFHYGVSICARNLEELNRFLDHLSESFGAIFFEKSLSILISFTHFRMKYLSKRCGPREYLRFGTAAEQVETDELDHKLLSTYVRQPSHAIAELARSLGESASTVDYRYKRLRDSEVIKGALFFANTQLLGMSMYLLLIYLKSVTPAVKVNFFEFCRRHPHVNFLIEFLGTWDYEVGVEVQSPTALAAIVSELYNHFGSSLNTVRILTVIDHPKTIKYPFRI
jgi:DNA-binding Lrp family transcriptional regulator